ncbi:MAG: hypothetical protein U1F59_08520 [Candidatus Competibacteraceae bacterium]
MRMKGRFAAGLFGQIRLAWLPVLAVYFAYGASALVGVATVFLQKDLGLTPAEVAGIGSGSACRGPARWWWAWPATASPCSAASARPTCCSASPAPCSATA